MWKGERGLSADCSTICGMGKSKLMDQPGFRAPKQAVSAGKSAHLPANDDSIVDVTNIRAPRVCGGQSKGGKRGVRGS